MAYSFIDATYQTSFVEGAGNNPAADANSNITVNPGNHLPGIPAHQLKLGGSYNLTDKWSIGATVIGASSQYLFGDEANLTPPLPGYVRLDLQTRYDLAPNVQLFAWARNVTNASYYTYGTSRRRRRSRSPRRRERAIPGATAPRRPWRSTAACA